VVTLHCPPPSDGRPLVGEPELARARRGLVLVNTARPALVDPAAVRDALDDGRLAAFATDVFETEPPEPSSLLRE
jgi:D-3-phosphoglycerate dehydrogenase